MSAVSIDLELSTLPVDSSNIFSDVDLIKGLSDLLNTEDLSNLAFAKATLGVTSSLSKKESNNISSSLFLNKRSKFF